MDTVKRASDLATAQGMSLAQLARKSNIAVSTLKNAKNRNYQLTVDTIEHLCSGLGITLSKFFEEEEGAKNAG